MTILTWPNRAWHDLINLTWHDMTWHDMTWHDMTWHDMTWHDMTWHDMTWHDPTGEVDLLVHRTRHWCVVSTADEVPSSCMDHWCLPPWWPYWPPWDGQSQMSSQYLEHPPLQSDHTNAHVLTLEQSKTLKNSQISCLVHHFDTNMNKYFVTLESDVYIWPTYKTKHLTWQPHHLVYGYLGFVNTFNKNIFFKL